MQPIMGFGIPFIHLNSIKHQPGFVKVWPRITIGLWPKSLCRFWKVFRITSYCSWKGKAYVQPWAFKAFSWEIFEKYLLLGSKNPANNFFDAYVSKPDKWNEAIWKRTIIVNETLALLVSQEWSGDGYWNVYETLLTHWAGWAGFSWLRGSLAE